MRMLSGPRAVYRDLDDHARAADGRRIGPHSPAVRGGDRLHDREAEPRSAGIARAAAVEAVEAIEYRRTLRDRDAGAVVVDHEAQPAVARLHPELDDAVCGGVRDRVAQEVAQRLREAIPV